MHIEEQPEGRFQIIFLLLLSFIRENSTEPLLWHLPSVVTAIKFTAEFSHEEGNRRSAFGGCLRSDVERVEIQKRWKSRDVETGGTFIEDDCVQCNRVGAAIPQLVTYSPLPPHLFPPSSSALPIFPVASLSFDDNNNDVVVVERRRRPPFIRFTRTGKEREIRLETNATFEAELTFKLPWSSANWKGAPPQVELIRTIEFEYVEG